MVHVALGSGLPIWVPQNEVKVLIDGGSTRIYGFVGSILDDL